jgi:RND family efflux transporter MFP subunit
MRPSAPGTLNENADVNVRMVMKKILGILLSAVLIATSLLLFPACRAKPGDSLEAPPGERAAEGQVALTADAARTAGIKTETARVRTFHPAVKASGTVALNQKKYVKVTPRVTGRVESVLAYEGDRVRAGQDLFNIWSPDLLAAQAEYLQILARVPAGGTAPASEDEKLHEGLLRSAEAKLRTMGFEDADIASLRANRLSLPVLAVRAPISGTVVEAEAAVGMAAEPGTCLCALADLTSLWVLVNVFEADLASVEVGAKAEITVTAYPGEVFSGTFTLVGAFIDEASRTVKGRVEVANGSGRLKPGMFGEVRIIAKDPVTMLSVPERAVRTIAGKTVVFLPGPGGSFVRRDIRIGRTIGESVEVLEGLREGESVVTDGSFDVKAELLKSTLEGEK